MTVQEAIDGLLKIEDKSKPLWVAGNSHVDESVEEKENQVVIYTKSIGIVPKPLRNEQTSTHL